MTINSEIRKVGPFIGNGTASAFPFTFKVFQASDLEVVRLEVSTNVETVLTLNSQYTVTLNVDQDSNPGGTVTLIGGALASGYTLTLTSDVPYLQPTDLTNQGGFYPDVINDALDRATIQIQQLGVEINRSLKVPVSSTVSTELPNPSANELLGWDSTGTSLTNVDPSTLATVVAYATAYADVFIGDGVTTSWTLTRPAGSLYNLDVSIQGVTQEPVRDYTMSGTTITFTTAPFDTHRVLVKYKEGLPNYEGDSQDVRYLPAGTGAVATTVQSKLRETVSVKDFGATGNGITDDSAAIRLALDAVPLEGGEVYFPEGVYYVPSVIYIPQRYSSSGYGITLRGANAKIIGNGSNTIFETGTGTVSTGGSSNWTQPPESSASIHFNSKIDNIQFANCGTALKLFNFIQNCAVTNCMFNEVHTAIYAKRCFYLDVTNCNAAASSSAVGTDVLYKFESFNNVMTIEGVSANGSPNKVVTGFAFLDGTYGNHFLNNAAEGCNIGIQFDGEMRGNEFTGWYIEGNNIGIHMGNATVKQTLIDGNWFYGNSTYAIYMPNTTTGAWQGVIGRSNTFETATDIVSVSGASNAGELQLPARGYQLGATDSYSRTAYPSSYALVGSTLIASQDFIYDPAGGYQAPKAFMEPYQLANEIIPFKFAGNVFDNHYGTIPFCKITNNSNPGPGAIIIDTKFNYDSTNGGYLFNFTVVDFSNTYNFAGIVYGGTIVQRFDSDSHTITASNNGGYLRLTLSNFTQGLITGKVRAV